MSTDLREAARALLDELDAELALPGPAVHYAPQVQSLRAALAEDDGMVRVPREPSETMIDAAFDATVWPDLSRATSSDVIASLRENIRKEYRAMVAAAEKETK